MSFLFGDKPRDSDGGLWTLRLATCFIAIAGLLFASTIPLNAWPQNDRDDPEVADVAPAGYDEATELIAGDDATPDEKPSLVARLFKQLRTGMGAALVGLAAAFGQPPVEYFRDRTDIPCEVDTGEDVADEIGYIDFEDDEFFGEVD